MNRQENQIEIVPSPRPEDDGPEAWRRLIAGGLNAASCVDRRRAFLDDDFVECDACAAKPGMPALCAGCVANRNTIGRLREKAGKR